MTSVSTISATRLALARSLITLGPSHPVHHLSGPFWWSLRGVATIFSLLSSDLFPTPGFMGLTASQRKGDAFLLGEALTHWFAQTHLDANVVIPLEAHSGALVPAAASAPYPKQMPRYFRHSVKPGAKSEPDFLAFSTAGQVHVLESKGRASFNSYGVTDKEINAARNKALRQVCKIATVNGLRPVTRTACVFAFDQSGLTGQITDPPETQPYNYIVEWPRLIRQAYATVLDPLFENVARDIGGNFVGIEFMPGWRFGIDRHVYKLVRSVEDAESAGQLLNFLANFAPEDDGERIAEERSIGRDGLILTGGPDYSEKIWRRELV
ncbi:hypothetical protein [Tsuneonella suprasediminis]|uniref:hypothetical protein n=1 Tax=Tsuneonella suprasediminis TaxID=2306996 RepID=UPI002F93E8A3